MGCRLIPLFLFFSYIGQYNAAILSDEASRAFSKATKTSYLSATNRLRYLKTGENEPSNSTYKEKKQKTNSKKNKKITMKHSMGMMQPTGKGNGTKAPKDVNNKKRMKTKDDKAPISLETEAPSPSVPSPVIPTPIAPVNTMSPVAPTSVAPINTPSPVVVPTGNPSPAPIIITAAPVTDTPTGVPDNVFLDSGNILVTYYTTLNQSQFDPAQELQLDDIVAAANLTCDFIQAEAIDPLGALEFACLWFLTDQSGDDLSMFPLYLVYSGTVAFETNTTVTAIDLDEAIINAFSIPEVNNLTVSLMTALNMTNPFSLTTSVTAENFGRRNKKLLARR